MLKMYEHIAAQNILWQSGKKNVRETIDSSFQQVKFFFILVRDLYKSFFEESKQFLLAFN